MVYLLSAVAVVVLGTKLVAGLRRASTGSPTLPGEQQIPPTTPADSAGADSAVKALPVPDSMLGRSRVLRFATLTRADAAGLPGFIKSFGERAIRTPAVYPGVAPDASPFSLFVLRPFGEKQGEFLRGYRLGRWPAEQWLMARNYFNPDGFVEVTPGNASLALSPHFVLGDFVTHDESQSWPRYVVLEETLIDKLELLLQDLQSHGYEASRAVVLSGFRAPYYNQRGVGEGMARASRHQYGDAADVTFDANGDGRMDDVNRDGRVDLADLAPAAAAITRLERAHPELVGGLGTYTAMGPRGPFIHVDVRGASARWESEWWKKKQTAK
jgi:hypothetical protein